MIKAVLIDVDNTLLDFSECSRVAMRGAFEKYGLTYTDVVFSTFHTVNDSLWLRIEKGTLTTAELHRIRWQMIFDRLGIAGVDGAEFEVEFFEQLGHAAVPVTGAREILRYLSGKYILCAASNAQYRQQERRLISADFFKYFAHIFTSGEIGAPKPSKEFFDGCFSKLPDIRPEEAIMIGDSLTADISGGIEYGLKTCWFNFFNAPVPVDMIPDFTVYALSEIKDIL